MVVCQDNKCKYTFGLLGWMILCGYFDEIEVVMVMVGHTHEGECVCCVCASRAHAEYVHVVVRVLVGCECACLRGCEYKRCGDKLRALFIVQISTRHSASSRTTSARCASCATSKSIYWLYGATRPATAMRI